MSAKLPPESTRAVSTASYLPSLLAVFSPGMTSASIVSTVVRSAAPAPQRQSMTRLRMCVEHAVGASEPETSSKSVPRPRARNPGIAARASSDGASTLSWIICSSRSGSASARSPTRPDPAPIPGFSPFRSLRCCGFELRLILPRPDGPEVMVKQCENVTAAKHGVQAWISKRNPNDLFAASTDALAVPSSSQTPTQQTVAAPPATHPRSPEDQVRASSRTPRRRPGPPPPPPPRAPRARSARDSPPRPSARALARAAR